MTVGRATELRLTAVKCFQDVVVPLEPLTVLIGRNGSVKSNALDPLSRLARADEVRRARGQSRRCFRDRLALQPFEGVPRLQGSRVPHQEASDTLWGVPQ